MTPEELSWFVDDVVVRALQGVKGVSQIERFGGVEREIRIALDPDRLLAFGITAGDVNRQLRATNVDLAGGRGEIGGREQAIRTLAGKQSVADLAATTIVLPRGRKVRLDQLGTVTDATAEPRTFAALDGGRWSPSPSRAPRAPATSWSPPTWPRRSRSCRRPTPTSSSS